MSATAVTVAPQVVQEELHVRTEEACGFHDITDDVALFVDRCGLEAGTLLLHSLHTTAGLLVNERETGFRRDFKSVADRLAPPGSRYCHDDMSVRFENICPEDREFPNGHSHLQQSIFGSPSIMLPVHGRRVTLGKWQRIFLIEFDRPRDRRIVMQAMGIVGPSGQPTEERALPQADGTPPAPAAGPDGNGVTADSLEAVVEVTDRDFELALEGLEVAEPILAAVREAAADADRFEARICRETAHYGPDPSSERVRKAALALVLVRASGLARVRLFDGEAHAELPADGGIGLVTSWLLNHALELCTDSGDAAVADAIEVARGLAEGRMMDVEDVYDIRRSPERYLVVAEKKGAGLARLGALLGARAAGAPEDVVDSLAEFGLRLGLVNEIVADIRDTLAAREGARSPRELLRAGIYALPTIYAFGADPPLTDTALAAVSDREALDELVAAAAEQVPTALEEVERQAALARVALDSVPCSSGSHASLDMLVAETVRGSTGERV